MEIASAGDELENTNIVIPKATMVNLPFSEFCHSDEGGI